VNTEHWIEEDKERIQKDENDDYAKEELKYFEEDRLPVLEK